MERDMNKLHEQKVDAEIANLIAQTAKINRETVFYPVIVTATLTLALVAAAGLFTGA